MVPAKAKHKEKTFERGSIMRRDLFLLIVIAAAILGVFYYAIKSNEPEIWENSAFVERSIYGCIH